jgi:hypothetical protein
VEPVETKPKNKTGSYFVAIPKLNRVIETAFVIANDFRALPLTQQYPWKESGEKTPLPEQVRKNLRKTFLGNSAWSGSGALYSNSKAQGRVVRRLIKKALGIVYDREIPGEDQQALNCHNTLLDKLNEAGYIPYRLEIDAMTKLPQPQDDYGKLLHQLKKNFRPE